MPITFSGPDEEFAAATGSNVHVSGTTSRFDNPPNAFTDLIITSNAGDLTPYEFDIGDTYDVSWGGHGGGGNMEDASVVRTDVLPGGEGIVVLEGINDKTGEVAQIIWTPGFDLEDWYWANYNPSAEPEFYVVDNDALTTYTTVCLAPETRIAAPKGDIAIKDLRCGDRVQTLDRGARTITWIGSRSVTGIGPAAPILFEAGSIGNHEPLRLSAQHRVLLAHPLAELHFGSSEVLVPAKSLVNGTTIRVASCPQVTWMNLTTDSHDLILAGGAPVETLWLGEVAKNVLGEADDLKAFYPGLADRGDAHIDAARPMLKHQEALALLAFIDGNVQRSKPKLASCLL